MSPSATEMLCVSPSCAAHQPGTPIAKADFYMRKSSKPFLGGPRAQSSSASQSSQLRRGLIHFSSPRGDKPMASSSGGLHRWGADVIDGYHIPSLLHPWVLRPLPPASLGTTSLPSHIPGYCIPSIPHAWVPHPLHLACLGTTTPPSCIPSGRAPMLHLKLGSPCVPLASGFRFFGIYFPGPQTL